MKALFGVVSLLVVLAIVGVLASRQLKSRQPALASVAAAASVSLAASATVKEQSKQIQDQVVNDVMKAMQQGADADRQEPR